MAYPGPPGVSSTAPSHHSLPARPPQPSKPPGFKPAFKPVGPSSYPVTSAPAYPTAPTSSYPSAPTSSYPSAPSYGVAGAPGGYGAPPTTTSYASNPSIPIVGAPRGGYNQASYGYQQSYQQPAYYGAGNSTTNFSTPPQIRNPFPVPNANPQVAPVQGYDAETAAQVAQWQSAYMPRDPAEQAAKGPGTANASGARYGAATTGYPGPQAVPAATTEAAVANAGAAPGEKKKTVYREGGGKKWQDDSLLEWDPAHQRLFVGNLAGETTDDSLLKAFQRWPSVVKAKVVRDKVTTKSRGYGFVSFSNIDDFFQAAKEMNGKYIQSHPVVIRKAHTEIRPQVVKDDKKRGKYNNKKGGNKNKNEGGKKSGNGAGGNDNAGGYEPHLGVAGGSGITKPGQKTRGGLKLLG